MMHWFGSPSLAPVTAKEAEDEEEQKGQACISGASMELRKDTNFGCMHYLHACRFLNQAHSWDNRFGIIGHNTPEEQPRIRVLVSEGNPCVVMFELYSLATLNMTDPEIMEDQYNALKLVQGLMRRRTAFGGVRPRAMAYQGFGPHFCPGGNHHPVTPPGASKTLMSTFRTTHCGVSMREMGIPVVTTVHGTSIGGGVAQSLETHMRSIVTTTSMCFGNLSRGACPVFLLSRHLPQLIGLHSAMEIYISDATFGSALLLKAGVATTVCRGISEAKVQGIRLATELATSQAACAVINLRSSDIDFDQAFQEGIGFMRGFQDGGSFSGGKESEADKAVRESQEKAEAEAGAAQEDDEDWDDWYEDEEDDWWDEEEGEEEGWWEEDEE